MTENINSEALDRLLELDGQFYDKPDLVRMARIRADVLHASAAWGSSEDGALINALADEVERLREALHDAICIIGHVVPMDTTILAGRPMVARDVWQVGYNLLYRPACSAPAEDNAEGGA